MSGTVIGAFAMIPILAAFPQDRVGFILALAAWCGLCGFAATVLQNFASYGAALAGYTAVIVASTAIADPSNVFLIAVWRASEICLGIVCAGVVLVLTGRGTARARAATTIATIARETGLGARATLEQAGGTLRESWPERRALIARAITLSALLDETVGESSDLRVRSNTLQAAVDGLFEALSGWRIAATHLETLSREQAAADAAMALSVLPHGPAIVMTAESSPASTRDRCAKAAAELESMVGPAPGPELMRVATMKTLRGLEAALNGVTLLVEPDLAHDLPGHGRLRVPDPLPAVINGIRSGPDRPGAVRCLDRDRLAERAQRHRLRRHHRAAAVAPRRRRPGSAPGVSCGAPCWPPPWPPWPISPCCPAPAWKASRALPWSWACSSYRSAP